MSPARLRSQPGSFHCAVLGGDIAGDFVADPQFLGRGIEQRPASALERWNTPGERHMPKTMGALLVTAGVVLVLVGLLAWSGALQWFGRLPGDIRIEREGMRVYVPIVSMLLVSIVLSLILSLVRRFFH
jgi:hypothetical protein